MYSFQVISLQNCPYSNAAKEFLDNKNIKYDLITVDFLTKNKYKSNEIDTFPQVYIVKKNKKILIGGYEDLKDINDNVFKKDMELSIKYLNKKFKNLSRKNKLRIIKVFNN